MSRNANLIDPDTAQQIRLLRHSLVAIRKQLISQLNAFDERLAALEPEEGIPSVQFPKTREGWRKFLDS
jgi:hypothetical protein